MYFQLSNTACLIRIVSFLIICRSFISDGLAERFTFLGWNSPLHWISILSGLCNGKVVFLLPGPFTFLTNNSKPDDDETVAVAATESGYITLRPRGDSVAQQVNYSGDEM